MEAGIRERLRKIGERWFVTLLLLSIIVEAFFSAISVFRLPGTILSSRIVLLSIPVVLGLAATLLLVKNIKTPKWIPVWIQRIDTLPHAGRLIRFSLWAGFVFFWATAFLPFSILGSWGAVYVRLQLVLTLAFFVIAQILAAWLFFTRNLETATNPDLKRSSLIPGIIFGAFIFIIILIVGFTGWGIGIGTQYWGKAGVPVLHWQIGLSLGIVLAGLYLAGRIKQLRIQKWLFDLIIFTGLWIAAFLIWQAVPVEISRFTTRPYPPNYVSYPFSDAGDYVLSAESILLGNGFQFGFIDKPIHQSFLVLLRLLTGSDFGKTILIQVAFMAVIPGLIYLITSSISNWSAGVLAGLITLFMQFNSLAAINRIQVSNVKMMMSEPLTGLMLMLVCLTVVSWWKKPGATWGYPALAGGLLGIAGLVRLNALVIAPFIGGIWLISFGLKKRKTWISLLVFSIFCLLPLVPWMARNQVKLGKPLAFITSKTSGVIFYNRFEPVMNDDLNIVPKPEVNSLQKESSTQIIGKKGITGLIQPMMHTGFHNLVAVGFVLPASWTHNGLDNTIRLPYWDQEWDGTFTQGGQVVFALSLLLVVIGFAAGWRKHRVLPLIPLLILVPYLLSNAISLVSGGRYIVPVDWILPVYFSIGLIAVSTWLLKIPTESANFISAETNPVEIIGWLKPEKLVLIVLLISCLPSGLSLLIPKKYLPVPTVETLNSLEAEFSSLPSAFSPEKIRAFSNMKDAAVFQGQAMFPRWMQTGIGDTGGSGLAFSALPFDHLSFSMLSHTNYPFEVVLPINNPVSYLPNASEVVVIGCQTQSYFDAAAVFVLSPRPAVYTRPDLNILACPFPQP